MSEQIILDSVTGDKSFIQSKTLNRQGDNTLAIGKIIRPSYTQDVKIPESWAELMDDCTLYIQPHLDLLSEDFPIRASPYPDPMPYLMVAYCIANNVCVKCHELNSSCIARSSCKPNPDTSLASYAHIGFKKPEHINAFLKYVNAATPARDGPIEPTDKSLRSFGFYLVKGVDDTSISIAGPEEYIDKLMKKSVPLKLLMTQFRSAHIGASRLQTSYAEKMRTLEIKVSSNKVGSLNHTDTISQQALENTDYTQVSKSRSAVLKRSKSLLGEYQQMYE